MLIKCIYIRINLDKYSLYFIHYPPWCPQMFFFFFSETVMTACGFKQQHFGKVILGFILKNIRTEGRTNKKQTFTKKKKEKKSTL